MGGIREDFGHVAIESRRESFIIHVEYGWRPARAPRKSLMPSDWFRKIDGDGPYRVLSIDEARVVYSAGDRDTFMLRDAAPVIPCDETGDPLDQEEDPDAGPFGKRWREVGHPEFLNEDLGDLIAALQELRDNPR